MGRKDLGWVLGVAVVGGVLANMASATITIETVPVGDVGNTGDTRIMLIDGTTGYGQVNYAYNIGKYEVTAGQYTAFLNAVAKTDTYGLYTTNMWSVAEGCKIKQDGTSGSYSYTVASDYANRPVTCVSFWDACRFTNWLSNGQKEDPSTTETGTYSLNGVANPSNSSITRNGDWQWAVTSEDEWYKAAYYKGGGTNAGYWLYPTSSDAHPERNMADISGNNANFSGTPYPIDSGTYYTTLVGEFQYSDSPYGTFDQGGNVWEWNEAIISDSYRGLRGGTFNGLYDYLQSNCRVSGNPTSGGYITGFRVSQVPEPAAIGILAFGVVGMLTKRRGAGR